MERDTIEKQVIVHQIYGIVAMGNQRQDDEVEWIASERICGGNKLAMCI
jgi:hypothetical protein